MFDAQLSERPAVVPTTLRLVRCYDRLAGVVASHEPIYFGSHWRLGRSWPCTKKLLGHCNWCKGNTVRTYSYLGVLVVHNTNQYYKAVLELPPDRLAEAMKIAELDDPYWHEFEAIRRAKRQPIRLTLSKLCITTQTQSPPVLPWDMLRTLSRIYGLPDPHEAAARDTWLAQVDLRTSDPEYSPAKQLPQED
jgi:hypothetical protein